MAGYYGYLFMQKRWQDNADFFQMLPTILQVNYSYVTAREIFRKVQTLSLHFIHCARTLYENI